MKILFSLAILVACVQVNAQITTRQMSAPAPKSAGPIPAYDSVTEDVDRASCRRLIGQEVYMLPKSKTYVFASRIDGYNHFRTQVDVMSPYYGMGRSDSADAKDNATETKKSKPKVKLPGAFHVGGISIPTGSSNSNSNANTPPPAPYKKDKDIAAENAAQSYNALQGKYCKILDVIDNMGHMGNTSGIFFKFYNPAANDTFYYLITKYGSAGNSELQMDYQFPFIVRGYFDKHVKMYKDTDFIAQNAIASTNDINNGAAVSVQAGEKLKCTDVTVTDPQSGLFKPIIVLKDSLGHEIAIPFRKSDRISAMGNGDFLSVAHISSMKRLAEKHEMERLEALAKMDAAQKEHARQDSIDIAQRQADRLKEMIKKYGTTNGTIISQGKVKIGFTKAMCVDSWGQPGTVNSDTYSWGTEEQWVYEGGYLYFSNDILKSIGH